MNVEHGKSFLSVDGDIITVKAVGPFNREGIVKTTEELKLLIESFGHKKFKILFDCAEAEGGPPDVFDKINELNIWLNSQNMIAKASVINLSMQLEILEIRSPARNLQNAKDFDNKSSAIAWLKLQS